MDYKKSAQQHYAAIQRLEKKQPYETSKICTGKYLLKDDHGQIWAICKTDDGKAWRLQTTGIIKYHPTLFPTKTKAIELLQYDRVVVLEGLEDNTDSRITREERLDHTAAKLVAEHSSEFSVSSSDLSKLDHASGKIYGALVFYLQNADPKDKFSTTLYYWSEDRTLQGQSKGFSNPQNAANWLDQQVTN